MKIRRLISIAAATVLSVTTLAFSASSAFAADEEPVPDNDPVISSFPATVECEDLNLNGDKVWTSVYEKQIPGYSGEGFAYLSNNPISFKVDVPEEGMYQMSARYAQILDQAGRVQTITVNDISYTTTFPYSTEWKDISLGMFRFKKGINKIVITPQYGYAEYDTLTIKKAVYPDLTKLDPTPCDKKATPEVKGLMNYLTSVYGKNILSGQQEIYGGGNDGNYELEFDFIHDLSGKYPAIRGFDMMNYNPLYGWDDNTTERIIEWANEKNGIPTVCWHINVPSNFANYELGDAVDWTECTYNEKSDFDTSKAIIEGTKENGYVMMAIEDLAEQLLRVQEADVPVIFRPFHEAEGNGGLDGSGAWFWWSKSGAEVYKELWKLLYTTLTEKYGIHNLIWEENLYTWSSESKEWYVGDEYVDIVGYDKYNTEYHRHDGNTTGPNEDAESSIFYTLVDYVNNGKMVSMPENDTIPSLSNLTIEKAYWLYFCPWYGEHILSSDKNNPDTVKELYQSDLVITLDELPENWKTFGGVDPTDPTDPTDPEIIAGDMDGNSIINVYDLILMKRMYLDLMLRPQPQVVIPPFPRVEDVTGDGKFSINDIVTLAKFLTGQDVTLKTYDPYDAA